MNAISRTLLVALILGGASSGPLAQNNDANALLAAHRGAIVQLQVKGKISNTWAFEYGTGFLVETVDGPRIVTAGHVVGPDRKWDSLIDRCVYYRMALYGSSQAFDCVQDARVEPNVDVAEVYLDPFNASTLEIASSLPAQGDDLAVTSWRSWGQPGSRATAQNARLVQLQPDRMILSGNYEPSDSGSPVLDGQGRVVGLMIEASVQPGATTQGIALPVTRFAAAISTAIASPILKSRLPALAEKILLGPAPFNLSPGFGCVFLGKRSATVTRRESDMPFGLTVLQSLRSTEGRDSVKFQKLVVETAVNIRTDCPTVVEGSAYYAPARAQLAPGDTFTPSEILTLDYLDDQFYWAHGDATPTSRRGSPR